ncbi:hypothetical protein U5A82_02345 [Sphingobium sp. CR2-8]|uniref:hypothetical protein n=1 Tax=Sphingobium sp. CR2-8 TaxID=1306534 RepID=UPI002DBD80F6|nr:hypothetical protein [Sphingobium sp. CR2-8]MEC3909354.1 hypothetical protein [Sphingobium sp. CR2-8]
MTYDILSGWTRLMASGYSMAQTGMRAYETINASNEVIAKRSQVIGSAMQSPLTGDLAELGRMVPEKVDAFSQAGSVTVAALWSMQVAWMGQMQHIGSMAMRGRAPTLTELADLGSRTASLTLESIEAGANLGSDSLAPVHRKAMANARRLRRKGARELSRLSDRSISGEH